MQESNYLKDRDDLLDHFKKLPFLASIEEAHLKKMLELSKLRNFRPGDVITREGEFDSHMYMIISGRVRIEKNGEQISKIFEQGDTFGELAIIDGKERSATVIADQYSTCLMIDAAFIDRLKPDSRDAFNAVFYRFLSEILAKRLRKTGEELSRAKEQLSGQRLVC